jgi:hypothetical protein
VFNAVSSQKNRIKKLRENAGKICGVLKIDAA